MAEANDPPRDPAKSKADTLALIAEAEAEAAEAEALAAAARARARAARLRREMEASEAETAEAETAEEGAETDENADESATGTAETEAEGNVSTTETDAVETTDAEEAETGEKVSEETPEDAKSDSKPRRFRRRVGMPLLSVAWKAAVILLICVFVAASGYMMWNRHEVTERNQRAANFIAGARQGVVNMLSMDFNRAKEDVQRVIDSSTGQFRDDFAQRAKDFTTVVEQSKVVTEGTVHAAAVQSINGDFALVLVAASSRITNAAGAKDEPRNWRLKVTVKNDGEQYKMSNVEFIP